MVGRRFGVRREDVFEEDSSLVIGCYWVVFDRQKTTILFGDFEAVLSRTSRNSTRNIAKSLNDVLGKTLPNMM